VNRLALTLILWAGVWGVAAAAPEANELNVWPDPTGGARVTAAVHIPAAPHVVQSILTDYEGWPALFNHEIRVASLERTNGRILTDLYIKRPLLAGEIHLLCETEEFSDGGQTRLVAGDFKRYLRTWRLRPDGRADATLAEIEMTVEPTTWLPNWVVTLALRRELERHFQILRERAAERAQAH
jgi:hypothetical protein